MDSLYEYIFHGKKVFTASLCLEPVVLMYPSRTNDSRHEPAVMSTHHQRFMNRQRWPPITASFTYHYRFKSNASKNWWWLPFWTGDDWSIGVVKSYLMLIYFAPQRLVIPSVPNYSSFDFLTPSLTTSLIQKFIQNIIFLLWFALSV